MLKRLGTLLNLIVPFPIAKLFYSFVAAICIHLCRILFPELKIWIRNSVAKGNFEPFYSDIDWTVLVPEGYSYEKVVLFSKLSRKARSLFPIIGETNIYFESTLPVIFKNINFYELQRDPSLVKLAREKFAISRSLISPTEKSVFLLRALESDLLQLKSKNFLRQKKWKIHFQEILGRPIDLEPDWISLEKVIAYELDPEQEKLIFEQLKVFYQRKFSNQPVYELEFQLKTHPWILASYPNHYCFTQQPLPRLEREQLELLILQLRWEIFGALTQFVNYGPTIFLEQLERIEKLIQRIQDQQNLSTDDLSIMEDVKSATSFILQKTKLPN